MRLLRLDLERYGPFTGRSLVFPEAAKLHVVYGPNEAGKSSALAAVTDLLFGIERQTPYDFIHEGRDMRLGAAVVARDGATLAFRRRKGLKATLVDAQDKALPDDVLTPFLGGLSRDVFCRAFGLNTESLRRGAEEMLTNKGDVGAALFAAATGLRGLNELRGSLEREAETIFAPRASQNRRFYQALARFEEARKAIRERELRAGDWKALNQRIEDLTARLDDVERRRHENAGRRARLSRLKRLAPAIRQIDVDLARLAALEALPEVRSGFADDLERALADVKATADACMRAEADRSKAVEAHAAIAVDTSLLERGGDIVHLLGESGAYVGNRRDLPRIQAEADGFCAQLAQLAIRLGRPDAAVLDREQPTDAALARVRGLITEGQRLGEERRVREKTLANERETLAELEIRRTDLDVPADPRPLRERLEALAPDLRSLDRLAGLEQAFRAERRSLAEAASRLQPPVADLDGLAALALPGAETIVRFRKDLDHLAGEIASKAALTAAKAGEIAEREGALRRLASGRPLPSPAAVAEERQARDAQWEPLRARLFGSGELPAGTSLPELVARFERHMHEADRLADECARDAEQIAQHAMLGAALEQERSRKAVLDRDLGELDARRSAVWDGWLRVWDSAGIVPLAPGEMAAWLSAVQALLDRRQKNMAVGDEIDGLQGVRRRVEAPLRALAADLAVPVVQDGPLETLDKRIDERLRKLAGLWDEARGLDARIDEVRRRIRKLDAEAEAAAPALAEWARSWSEALPDVGLRPAMGVEEADAALNAWKEVPGLIRERDNRARRVAGMSRNIEAFEARTRELVSSLAADLATLPADAAAKALNERLVAAKDAKTRQSEAAQHLATARQSHTDAGRAAEAAQAALSQLAAAFAPGTDLAEHVGLLKEREALRAGLAERRAQFLAQAEGFDEETVRAELVTFDPDQAQAELDRLAEDERRLTQEAQERYAERDRELRRREELERGVGAETAAQQRRNAEAELAQAAREWAVLKLAALLIGGAVERHRAGQADPLMTRAGELFATLTGRSFHGLGQDYDDDDVPRLTGRRPSGEAVRIEHMSEGTRDQLYLALRLAYLEDFARRSEAAPFIGDDILTTFDDGRTLNGLAALVAIGAHIQPILFTHHRKVADLAEAHFGADAHVLELA